MQCTITKDNNTSWYIQCDTASNQQEMNGIYALTYNTCDDSTCYNGEERYPLKENDSFEQARECYNVHTGMMAPCPSADVPHQGPVMYTDSGSKEAQECYNAHTGMIAPCPATDLSPVNSVPIYEYNDKLMPTALGSPMRVAPLVPTTGSAQHHNYMYPFDHISIPSFGAIIIS